MPITQTRMIALIAAARDLEQAFDGMIMLVHTEFTLAQHGQKTWQEAAASISNMLRKETLLQRPAQTLQIIAVEDYHFKRTASANDIKAKSMARKRRKHECGRADTNPDTLVPEPTVPSDELQSRGLIPEPKPAKIDPETKAKIDAEIDAALARDEQEANSPIEIESTPDDDPPPAQ